MKLVIDVPEEDYKYLKSHNENGLYNVILNGKPIEQEPNISDIRAEMENLAKERLHKANINGYKNIFINGMKAGFEVCLELVDKYNDKTIKEAADGQDR